MSELLELILVFLKIGAISFGGGWTIVGIIKNEILSREWLTEAGFSQLIAIAQVTPGPVALNSATLVGFNISGLPGAIAATLAVITIPLILVLGARALLSRLGKDTQARIDQALRTGTVALVSLTVWTFLPQASRSLFGGAMAVLAFAVTAFTKLNPLWIILGAGLINGILSFWTF